MTKSGRIWLALSEGKISVSDYYKIMMEIQSKSRTRTYIDSDTHITMKPNPVIRRKK